MADKYSVNYDDERFQAVENEKTEKLTQTENMYNNMLANSDKYYQDQINASKEWSNKQQELQQEKTDFAIEQINQQKEQAQKDYIKEQKGAYSDWQKQSNKYGANAEALASSGLSNSGYAQSSQVSMWNTYQNRKMTATENLNKAILNYDNNIKEAQLANNSTLAELAYTALQNELELALQGFQAKNQLLLQKEAQLQSINDNYYNRYQNVLAQINAEIERQREYDMWYEEFKQRQAEYEASNRQWQQEFALREQQYAIENARAEREIQAALANEANLTVNTGNASDNTNIPGVATAAVSGTVNALSSNNSSLSNSAQNLLRSLSILSNNPLIGNSSKTRTMISNQISDAIANGYITESEARKIVNQLNS